MVNYNYVVMIPARGGSKSIPLKNIKEIAGQPLIYWSLDAAVNSKYVDKVFVSTDSEEIRKVVLAYDKPNKEKIEVIERSKECSIDTATTEDVMFDFSSRVDYENMVLIQCTNPMIKTSDLFGFKISNAFLVISLPMPFLSPVVIAILYVFIFFKVINYFN